jgi:hypothetical protein
MSRSRNGRSRIGTIAVIPEILRCFLKVIRYKVAPRFPQEHTLPVQVEVYNAAEKAKKELPAGLLKSG